MLYFGWMVIPHFLSRVNFQRMQAVRKKLHWNISKWVTLCGNMGWGGEGRQKFDITGMNVGKKELLLWSWRFQLKEKFRLIYPIGHYFSALSNLSRKFRKKSEVDFWLCYMKSWFAITLLVLPYLVQLYYPHHTLKWYA